MQNESGQTWAVGAIANGHVLTQQAGWVRINARTNRTGPWRPGDVVNGHVFTGDGWVALQAGWRPDPTGQHQFRWCTGDGWTSHALTNGRRYIDPLTPTHSPPVDPPTRTSRTFWDFIDGLGWSIYAAFWFVIAIYSATTAWQEREPRYLLLTSTASLNIFLYKLTGRTRRELNRGAIAAVKSKLPYLFWGAIAAGGVWLGLHFDDPDIVVVALFVASIGLIVSWVFS